jgi:hypothetical protein
MPALKQDQRTANGNFVGQRFSNDDKEQALALGPALYHLRTVAKCYRCTPSDILYPADSFSIPFVIRKPSLVIQTICDTLGFSHKKRHLCASSASALNFPA